MEFFIGFSKFIGYYGVLAFLLVIFKILCKPEREVFRKLLHCICFMSVFVLLNEINQWYIAALVSLSFAVIVYPVVAFMERYPKFMSIFNERKEGEVKSSLLIVFLMMALLIFVFWGVLGAQWKYIIIVSITAWGFGDAAAALVGKKWGKNVVIHPLVEGKKTKEGTLAMFIVSSLSISLNLKLHTNMPWYLCFGISLLIAPICALVELISKNGMDTITVPIATAVPLYILMMILHI